MLNPNILGTKINPLLLDLQHIHKLFKLFHQHLRTNKLRKHYELQNINNNKFKAMINMVLLLVG